MAFLPKGSILVNSSGTSFEITDITGAYNGTTNLDGWYLPTACHPGIKPSDVTAIDIEIYDNTGITLLQTFSVSTSVMPSLYSGDFSLGTLSFTFSTANYYFNIIYTTPSCTVQSGNQLFNVILEPFPEEDIQGCLDICLSNSCNKLEITECTSTTTSSCNLNPVGWYYDPTAVNTTEKVYIEVYDQTTASLIQTIYLLDKTTSPVTNLFPSPFNDKFDLPLQDFNFGDGIYEFKYIIEVTRPFQPNYTVEIGNFLHAFYCNAQYCVDNLWLRVFNECDKKEKNKLMDIAQDAEILLLGVKSKLLCLDTTVAEEIRKTLNELCDIANCEDTDCGCK